MTRTTAVLRAAGAACNRVMDELPTLFLGSIAIMALRLADPGAATFRHDVVLGVVTGLLGYMKSPRSAPPPKAPDQPPPAS